VIAEMIEHDRGDAQSADRHRSSIHSRAQQCCRPRDLRGLGYTTARLSLNRGMAQDHYFLHVLLLAPTSVTLTVAVCLLLFFSLRQS